MTIQYRIMADRFGCTPGDTPKLCSQHSVYRSDDLEKVWLQYFKLMARLNMGIYEHDADCYTIQQYDSDEAGDDDYQHAPYNMTVSEMDATGFRPGQRFEPKPPEWLRNMMSMDGQSALDLVNTDPRFQ